MAHPFSSVYLYLWFGYFYKTIYPGNGYDNAISKYNFPMFVFNFICSLCHFWLGFVKALLKHCQIEFIDWVSFSNGLIYWHSNPPSKWMRSECPICSWKKEKSATFFGSAIKIDCVVVKKHRNKVNKWNHIFFLVVVIVDYQRNVAHKNKSGACCECVCMWLCFHWRKHNMFRFSFNYSCICYNKILDIENVNGCVSPFSLYFIHPVDVHLFS